MTEDIVFFPENAGSSTFDIQMCGTSYCDGTYRINRPNSTIYCIEYICKGKGYVQLDDICFTASQGDIYILPQRMSHYYYSDDKDPWEKKWFNISGSFVESTIRAYGLGDLYHVKNLDLRILFEEFICHADAARNNSLAPINLDLCAIDFLKIVQAIASAPELQEKYLPTNSLQQLKYRLDTLTDFTIPFSTIINDFFYTKSHLIRSFKLEYGMTPYHYLLERKVSTAKQLLKNTAMSITEIAHQLGFGNCHYFSAFFSQRVGMSPSEYRHAQLQQH